MGGGQKWTAIQKTWKRRDWREHPIAHPCPRFRKSCPWSRGAPAPQPASSSCLRCAYQLVWESGKCSKCLSHCPEESPEGTASMSPGGCPSTRERALWGEGSSCCPSHLPSRQCFPLSPPLLPYLPSKPEAQRGQET